MPKPTQTTALTCLLALLPIAAIAQTCKTDSIPATTPTSQFTVNGDGTVTDTKTGLMWKKCAEGQSGFTCGAGGAADYTWQEAFELAQTVNTTGGFATYVDWRLPNIKELSSIVDRQCNDPAINLTVFPNAGREKFWSSSPNANFDRSAEQVAWQVDFYGGSTSMSCPKCKFKVKSVRLVRSGQ